MRYEVNAVMQRSGQIILPAFIELQGFEFWCMPGAHPASCEWLYFQCPSSFPYAHTHKQSQLHVLMHTNDESIACDERFLSVWKERWNQSRPKEFVNMDTLGFEPRAFRMRSGCDTTTPCARGGMDQEHITSHNDASVLNPNWTLTQ